jgi:uncharacterized protein (TIGR03067 family)
MNVVLAAILIPLTLFSTQVGVRPEDNLDGTWLIESYVVNGKAVPDEARKASKLVIRGETFEFHSPRGVRKGTFKIDSTTKPKTMDVTPSDGTAKGKILLGIYVLESDTLTNSHLNSQTERPKDFSSKPGSRQTLIVYKRQRP